MIRKIDENKYRIYSKKGKNLGTYRSLSKAKERLRQIEFFKHKKASSNENIENKITYCATIRYLRKKYPDKIILFLKKFKEIFESKPLFFSDSQEHKLVISVLKSIFHE